MPCETGSDPSPARHGSGGSSWCCDGSGGSWALTPPCAGLLRSCHPRAGVCDGVFAARVLLGVPGLVESQQARERAERVCISLGTGQSSRGVSRESLDSGMG